MFKHLAKNACEENGSVIGCQRFVAFFENGHYIRVKSGNFGHQVNSDIHSHQDFHYLLSLFFIPIIKYETNKVAVRNYPTFS